MSAAPDVDLPIGLPRNYVRPCLLLLLADGTAHGYELLHRLHGLGVDPVDPGGMYRCLRGMESERLVRSRWEPSTSGPARRRYELTEDGWRSLSAVACSLADSRRVLDDFLARYDRVPRTQGRAG